MSNSVTNGVIKGGRVLLHKDHRKSFFDKKENFGDGGRAVGGEKNVTAAHTEKGHWKKGTGRANRTGGVLKKKSKREMKKPKTPTEEKRIILKPIGDQGRLNQQEAKIENFRKKGDTDAGAHSPGRPKKVVKTGKLIFFRGSDQSDGETENDGKPVTDGEGRSGDGNSVTSPPIG